MSEQFAIVGTYDEVARKVKQRCAGVFSTMLLDPRPGLHGRHSGVPPSGSSSLAP